MINIIHHTFSVTDINQGAQHLNDIFLVQGAGTCNFFAANTAVELHPANGRQIVALTGKEQVIEQAFCRILGGRLTWTHHAVDFNQSFQLVGSGIDLQCV